MPTSSPQLLKLISCKYKKYFRAAYGYRKSGLRCSAICLQCNNTCENAPNEDIGDLENDQEDPDEINLDLLIEEIDKEEDSLEQSYPRERSDKENTKDLMIGELIFFIFLTFSSHAILLFISVHLSLSLPILDVKMC